MAGGRLKAVPSLPAQAPGHGAWPSARCAAENGPEVRSLKRDIEGGSRKAGASGEEGGRVMNLEMFVMWVVVGLMGGWLAGIVMKGGGYGRIWDLVIGLAGSIMGSVIFRGLEISPGAGLFALIVVAFIGAAVMIVAQRKFLHARA